MLNQIFQIKLWMLILSIVSSMAASSLITYVVSHSSSPQNNGPVAHYCPSCPICPTFKAKHNTSVWKPTPLPAYRGGKSY